MAWSIFTDGGGNAGAVQWARDICDSLGLPQTLNRLTFFYRWETSEGGGGKYNPLNQGPVADHPEWTTTGSQYGGGAADYATWHAGIQGAVTYLYYSYYSGVLNALINDDLEAAQSALWDSPWAASHYGHGSGWANVTLPAGTQVEDEVTPQDIQAIAAAVAAKVDHTEVIQGQQSLDGSLQHLATVMDGIYNAVKAIQAKVGA